MKNLLIIIGTILLGTVIFQMMVGDSPTSLKSITERVMLHLSLIHISAMYLCYLRDMGREFDYIVGKLHFYRSNPSYGSLGGNHLFKAEGKQEGGLCHLSFFYGSFDLYCICTWVFHWE